jgi:hypothetical protein
MPREEPVPLRTTASDIEKLARKLRTLSLQKVDDRVWIDTVSTVEKALRAIAEALREIDRHQSRRSA